EREIGAVAVGAVVLEGPPHALGRRARVQPRARGDQRADDGDDQCTGGPEDAEVEVFDEEVGDEGAQGDDESVQPEAFLGVGPSIVCRTARSSRIHKHQSPRKEKPSGTNPPAPEKTNCYPTNRIYLTSSTYRRVGLPLPAVTESTRRR